MAISKTSVNGALALLIAVCVALLASGSPLIGQTATVWLMLGLAVLRAVVGFLQGDSPNDKEVARMWGKGAAVLLVGALCVGSVGCSDWERSTFQTLSASKATIDTAAADYRSGALPQTAATFDLIEQARKAQVAAVDSMVVYERIKTAAGGAAVPSAVGNQQAVVLVALAAAAPLVAQITALYAKK